MDYRVYVYGTLRKDFGAARIVGPNGYHTGRVTKVPGLELYALPGGHIPGAYPGCGSIVVEEMLVNYNGLRELDKYEGVQGGLYYRVIMKDETGAPGFIYIVNPSYVFKENKVESGDWAKFKGVE